MEKEKVLEIEITKINDEYSLARVTKINTKFIEEKKKYKFGYANSSILETNSELHKEPNFRTYISDTIKCYDLYINSENDCFTIKNNLVESLELFLQEFNKKYGTPKRWRAEKGGVYLYIKSTGEVTVADENRSVEDIYRYELGNYFEFEKQAVKVKNSKEWQEFWAKVRAGEIGGNE